MVARLFQVFGQPKKPDSFRQDQFDEAHEALRRTAKKDWHEVEGTDYWHYLLDLCYIELDQGLFDHLFPAFLIRWWEGQLDRTGGPDAECDIYRAIDHGQILTKMMSKDRRAEVLAWMVDGYIQGVDAWGGHLAQAYSARGPDNLHGPLWSFHALGQSIPICAQILDQLAEVTTEGRAQWWLVFASGLVWNENEVPAIPPWTPKRGGGGVYILESAAAIYAHGYLPDNLLAISERLTYDLILECLRQANVILAGTAHKEWSAQALELLRDDPPRISLRIKRFSHWLAEPDLGGVLLNPLDSEY